MRRRGRGGRPPSRSRAARDGRADAEVGPGAAQGDRGPSPAGARSVTWRTYLRPTASVPLLALALSALYLAEVVEPWPEGRILVTLRGLGPHGVTLSDVVVLAAVAALGFGWLRLIAARDERDPASPDAASTDAT